MNTYRYDIWGKILSAEETIPNPLRGTGEYYDEESGLYYQRGRYYDPSVRRFTTPDPAEDGINHYAYCGNNPIDYRDPSGYVKIAVPNPDPLIYSDIYYSDKDLLELNNGQGILESIGGLLSFSLNMGAAMIMSMISGPKVINAAYVCYQASNALQQGKGLRIRIHANGLRQPTFSSADIVELSEIPHY